MKNVTKDSLLLEVDADVRAERMAQLWSRHKGLFFGFIAVVLLVTIGNAVRKHYVVSQGEQWMVQLNEAQRKLELGQAADAAEGFAAVARATSGETQALVSIWQARALVAAGNMNEAVAVLKLAAASQGIWADVACVRLASLAPKEAACLGNKAATPIAPTRHLWEAAAAWEAGDAAKAKDLLAALIGDEKTSDADRQRAVQWLAVIDSAKGAR